ncbi:CD36 [Balamuthia mandrillaris]
MGCNFPVPFIVTGSLVLLFSIIFIILGPTLYYALEEGIDEEIEDTTIIDGPLDDGYTDWLSDGEADDPLPQRAFYLFDVTNKDALMSGEETTPIIEQKGPFFYKYVKEKVDVEFKDDGREVSYKFYEHHHFMPELSEGNTEEDLITTLNFPYIAAITVAGGERELRVGAVAGFLAKLQASLEGEFTEKLLLDTMPRTISTFAGVAPNFANEWYTGNTNDVTVAPGVTISDWGLAEQPTFNPALVADLFDPATPYSLVSPGTFAAWLQALQDSTVAEFIQSMWAITADDQALVSSWLADWKSTHHVTLLSLSNDGATAEELGVYQWASLKPASGGSLRVLSPEDAPFYVEFAAWSTYVDGSAETISLDSAVKLFRENETAITDPLNLGTLMTYITLSAWSSIEDRWGLNQTQAMAFGEYYNYVLANTLEAAMQQNSGLWTTRSAKELIFGYVDPIFALLRPDNAYLATIVNHTSVEDAQANALWETRYTGKGGVGRVARYKEWREDVVVPWWNPPEEFDGTDAVKFAPGLDDDEPLSIFSQTLRRNIQIIYSGEKTVRGITLYEYEEIPGMLDSAAENPDNARYFTELRGLHNLTAEPISGVTGLPIFVSKVHFRDVDETEAQKITLLEDGEHYIGMHHIPEKHAVYIRIEPRTGFTMDARKRLQLNVQLVPSKYSVYHQNTPEVFLPVYWADEGSTINDKKADEFKDSVYYYDDMANDILISFTVIGCVGFVVGLVFLVVGIVFHIKGKRANAGDKPQEIRSFHDDTL